MANALQTFLHGAAQGSLVDVFMRAKRQAQLADYQKKQAATNEKRANTAASALGQRKVEHGEKVRQFDTLLPIRQQNSDSGMMRARTGAADFVDKVGGGAEARDTRKRMRGLANDPEALQRMIESGYDPSGLSDIGAGQDRREVGLTGRKAGTAASARMRQKLKYDVDKSAAEKRGRDLAEKRITEVGPNDPVIHPKPSALKLTPEEMRKRMVMEVAKAVIKSRGGDLTSQPITEDDVRGIMDIVGPMIDGASGATAPPPAGATGAVSDEQIVDLARQFMAQGVPPQEALQRARQQLGAPLR